LADANEIAVESIPPLDLRDGDASPLGDQAQRISLANHDHGCFGLRSDRSQRGEAQQCDPERSEHLGPV
jgi:hypothetical protein